MLERDVEVGGNPEYTQTILYVATCDTCGWESDQLEDRNQVVLEEWQHIRQYTIGVEHKVKLHAYLVTTRIDDITDLQ